MREIKVDDLKTEFQEKMNKLTELRVILDNLQHAEKCPSQEDVVNCRLNIYDAKDEAQKIYYELYKTAVIEGNQAVVAFCLKQEFDPSIPLNFQYETMGGCASTSLEKAGKDGNSELVKILLTSSKLFNSKANYKVPREDKKVKSEFVFHDEFCSFFSQVKPFYQAMIGNDNRNYANFFHTIPTDVTKLIVAMLTLVSINEKQKAILNENSTNSFTL